MALIKCPDCGREVSDKATACVHCGCPLAEEVTRLKENSWLEEKEAIIAKDGFDEVDFQEYIIDALEQKDDIRLKTIVDLIEKYTPENLYVSIYKWILQLPEDVDKRQVYLENLNFVPTYITRLTDLKTIHRLETLNFPVYPQFKIIYLADEFFECFGKELGEHLYDDILVVSPLMVAEVEKKLKLSKELLKYTQTSKSSRVVNVVKEKNVVISIDDLKFIKEEEVEKLRLDMVQIGVNMLNATKLALSLEPDITIPKKPTSVGTNAMIGGVLGGVPGAVIGAAVGLEKGRNYDSSYSDYQKAKLEKLRLDEERKEANARLKDKPMKMYKYTRYIFAIKTYVGDVRFYLDTDGEFDMFHNGKEIILSELKRLTYGENVHRKQMKEALLESGNIESVIEIEEVQICTETYENANKLLKKATTVEECKEAKKAFFNLNGYLDSNDKANEAIEKEREIIYKEATECAESVVSVSSYDGKIAKYKNAIKLLEEIEMYKDSKNLIEKYNSKIKAVKLEKEMAEDKKKREKLIKTISAIFIILIIVVVIVVSPIVATYNEERAEEERIQAEYNSNFLKYKEAENYYEAKKYGLAAKLYEELGEFKDSRNQYKDVVQEYKIAFNDAMKEEDYDSARAMVEQYELNEESYKESYIDFIEGRKLIEKGVEDGVIYYEKLEKAYELLSKSHYSNSMSYANFCFEIYKQKDNVYNMNTFEGNLAQFKEFNDLKNAIHSLYLDFYQKSYTGERYSITIGSNVRKEDVYIVAKYGEYVIDYIKFEGSKLYYNAEKDIFTYWDEDDHLVRVK